ncbi:Trihelix transcription factor GT-3a, partial [Linum grandiflorum]
GPHFSLLYLFPLHPINPNFLPSFSAFFAFSLSIILPSSPRFSFLLRVCMDHHHHHQHHHPHHLQQQQQLHHPYLLQQQQQHQAAPPQQQSIGETGDSRFPQWSIQETKEFLAIRSELDRTFMETKRNKLLWEVISSKMKDKGFLRSPEQCKCKWKNLVTRYKGCETMEPESMRQQFPFYNELQAIFAGRMQRMLWAEAEAGSGSGAPATSSGSRKRGQQHLMSSDDEEDDDDIELEAASEGDKPPTVQAAAATTKNKKMKKGKVVDNSSGGNAAVAAMKEVLEEFTRQQMAAEAAWREAYEARENERRMQEMEWRRKMEALENERLMMERRWRDREEQRRVRDEARAEKRDALISALLNKLARDDT